MENSRFLLRSPIPKSDGTPAEEPWRYQIEPYWEMILRASGEETKPFRFSARADVSAWVRWNQERDEAMK
jgi:hypothetical protein